MDSKKILMSFLLVALIALSVASVSAEDVDDVISTDDAVDAIAADDSVDVLSDDISPTNNTASAVQTAVYSAKSGDTVDLSKYSDYDFAGNTVTVNITGITIDGKGTTTIKGYGDGNGIFAIKAANVTIQGIKFIDTNPKNDFKYNGTVAGWGISVSAAPNGAVRNCEFTDFNSGIVVMQTTGFTIENNKFNGGYTTKLLNDPTVNKEEGSKSLNIYRQSSKIVVKNNTFEGPILDGVSIAQGSGSNQVLDNTFIGNCYSIYFGGASTKGTVIRGNKFINCGYFKEGNISWSGLPVISIQKASDDISIENNNFSVIDNNILIAAEKGNEAHGSPTEIGNINITGNKIVKYNDTVDASTVTLFHILIRDASSLEISSPLNVTGNTYPSDVKGISIWINGNEVYSSGDAVIENVLYTTDTIFNTTLTVSDVTVTAGDAANLVITLKNSNNSGLINKVVMVAIDGKIINAVTDENGVATVPVNSTTAGVQYASIVFLGEGNLYGGSIASAKITVNAKPVPPVVKKVTTLTAKKATLKVKKAKKIQVTLKSEGKALAGKTVTIKVNKKTFKAKTNAKGVATIKVKVTKKGKFTATVKFAGDSEYNAATKNVKFTVKK
ncbi:right-handed parallel beta-helix repeat-containing protein [Methanobrevibacter sp.]|uniref:right-handed parallel beta-helix repeat-containing protein n=1 Tax=Methanobrevibacter sp. TaxID=66852 RepID=UPI0038646695